MSKVERNLWKESEINALLSIIEKQNIAQIISEKKYRSKQIFRFVEAEMHAKGFTKKSCQQIWTKWKFLKSSYVTARRHNSLPGSMKRTCDFYTILDRILRNQPEIIAITNNTSIQDNNSTNYSSNANNNLLLSDNENSCFDFSNSNSSMMEMERDEDSFYIKEEPIEIEGDDIIDRKVNLMSLPKLQPISQITNQNNNIPTTTYEETQSSPQSLISHSRVTNEKRKRKSLHMRSEIPDLVQVQLSKIEAKKCETAENSTGPAAGPSKPKKISSQTNYLHALKDLAINLRQMQKELISDFFQKQEEIMREEHEFQRQQDEMLLRSFEEQTKLLLDSARNLLVSNIPTPPVAPEVVYIDEE